MKYPEHVEKIIKEIIEEAEKSLDYEKRLFEFPKEVLKEKGIYVPKAFEIRVYRDSKKRICIKPTIDLPDECCSPECQLFW